VRKDLDWLMKERGIAGMVVLAVDRYTPAMYYVLGQKVHVGVYFRTADGRSHLIVDPMERDQAEATGVEYSGLPQHGWIQRLDKHPNPVIAYGEMIAEMLDQLGVKGPVSFFGDLGATQGYELLSSVQSFAPGVTIDTTFPDMLTMARATKDEDEVVTIRRASDGVLAAWNALLGKLGSLRRDGEHFKDGDGPITIGRLRALLHEVMLRHGLEAGESIVSQGRDAGVPHNRGDDKELLRAGAPVIVDIFPGEAGGGYYSDFTRTFCMGKASDELRRIYGDCRDAFEMAMKSLKLGEPCRSYQEKVCDLYESRGHATLRSHPGTQEGYVHGLGHGVGLSVHEAPRLGGPPSNQQKLAPGMVITVEPGLYYPSRGMGVRIEDLVVARPDGSFEDLTRAPYDRLEIEPAA
jgi:Xaa-Pro aminopeptidase